MSLFLVRTIPKSRWGIFSFTVEVKFRRDKNRVAPGKGGKKEQAPAAAPAPPPAPALVPKPAATGAPQTGNAVGGNPA